MFTNVTLRDCSMFNSLLIQCWICHLPCHLLADGAHCSNQLRRKGMMMKDDEKHAKWSKAWCPRNLKETKPSLSAFMLEFRMLQMRQSLKLSIPAPDLTVVHSNPFECFLISRTKKDLAFGIWLCVAFKQGLNENAKWKKHTNTEYVYYYIQ